MNLTPRRLELIRPVLDEYRQRLEQQQRFDWGSLEKELREILKTGYQDLKGIMLALLNVPRYRHVAAYYMDTQNPGGPVSEFLRPLADLYGTRAMGGKEFADASKRYWDGHFGRRAAVKTPQQLLADSIRKAPRKKGARPGPKGSGGSRKGRRRAGGGGGGGG